MTFTDKKENLFWLTACLAVYTVLFFIFYPPVFAVRDEGIYLAIASLLKQGTLYLEKTSIPLMMGADIGGHRVPVYPPGNSLLLLPFLQMGWQKVFLCGFLIHAGCVFLVRRLSRIFNIENPLAPALYLFFPAFLFYSRTIMSDMPSMALFLAAAVFYFQPGSPKVWAGVLLGISLFFRVSNVILFIPFGLGLLVSAVKTRSYKDLLMFVLGGLPFIAGTAVYNTFLYGGPLMAGYSEVYSGVKNFSPAYFPGNFKHYFLALNFAYPFMLLVFFSRREFRRVEFYALTAMLTGFFGFYYFHDKFPGLAPTLMLGTRFFFPLVPFLILGYAAFLWDLASRLPGYTRLPLIGVFMLVLWLGGFLIVARHQIALKKQNYLKTGVYEVTRENDTVIYDAASSELVQEAWGKRRYFFDQEMKEEDLLREIESGNPAYWIRRKPYAPESVPAAFRTSKIKFRDIADNADLTIVAIYPDRPLKQQQPEV